MLALLHESFWLVPFSILLAGVVGSPHCLSMCGPIVANFSRRRIDLLAYQIGRLVSYTAAGALVGSFGQTLLKTRQTEWLSQFSLFFIALVLVINAYRIFKGNSLHIPIPLFINQMIIKLWRQMRLSRCPGFLTAGMSGLLTLFFPCGHLYSFLIGAVATGSALGGAIFMFAFALGSAPLLSLGGQWIQKWIQSRQKNYQRLAGVFLLGAGLISILVFGTRLQNSFSSSPASSPASLSEENHHH